MNSAHPLQETRFEFVKDNTLSPQLIRHLYHIPKIGEWVWLVEKEVWRGGYITDVTWSIDEQLVTIRVEEK